MVVSHTWVKQGLHLGYYYYYGIEVWAYPYIFFTLIFSLFSRSLAIFLLVFFKEQKHISVPVGNFIFLCIMLIFIITALYGRPGDYQRKYIFFSAVVVLFFMFLSASWVCDPKYKKICVYTRISVVRSYALVSCFKQPREHKKVDSPTIFSRVFPHSQSIWGS